MTCSYIPRINFLSDCDLLQVDFHRSIDWGIPFWSASINIQKFSMMNFFPQKLSTTFLYSVNDNPILINPPATPFKTLGLHSQKISALLKWSPGPYATASLAVDPKTF